MPLESRIECDWLIIGFHLGQAKDAFDPQIARCGDELVRSGLLRRLTSTLFLVRDTRPSIVNAHQEAEELEPLWSKLQEEYTPSPLTDDRTDSRLVLIYEGLLRLENWLQRRDEVFGPASNARLAFELGIELGRSCAEVSCSHAPSDEDMRWPDGPFWTDSQPDWYGWTFREPLKVLELAWRLGCTPIELTDLPFGLPFIAEYIGGRADTRITAGAGPSLRIGCLLCS